MFPGSRPATSRPRPRPLVVILVLTLVLTGVLTYEAWDAAHRHRSQAERTLREYAAFAAWEFNISVKEQLYATLVWMFSPVAYAEVQPAGVPLAPPSILAPTVRHEHRCDAEEEPSLFRLDIATGALHEHGGVFSPAMAAWIHDTVLADVRSGRYGRDQHYSAVFGTVTGAKRGVVYQVKWGANDRPLAAYGFEFCMRSLAPPSMQKVLLKSAILPPSMTGGQPNDSILSIVVSDGMGHEIFRSVAQYESPFRSSHTIEYLGSLRTEVTLRDDVADRMLIGGLPRSRLPLLLGVLTLAVALVVTGIAQLRREAELQRLRADFVASVSHELRTPLAQLRMFAETLLLGRVRSDSERSRSLTIIDQEARRLSHLVENILQFSRAERRSLHLSLVEEELAPHVRDAVEVFSPVARARQVSVETVVAGGLHAAIDAGAIRQVLLNLLDNAVKYGPAGQRLRVTLAREGSRARIMVDDEGPGIPASDRVRIWRAFQRLERDVNSAVAGSGIGLAVVCELVLGMGGKGWVEEAPWGRGARFVVELPLTRGDGAAA